MYRILLALILATFAAITASAKIEVQSLNNIDSTNIVLVDDTNEGKTTVTKAVLHNNGKNYEAKAIHCESKSDGTAINLKFKKFKHFSNCSVTLIINGETVIIPIQEHLINTMK